MSKTIDRLFVIGVCCILLLCLAKAVFFPDEVNVYENRTADKIGAFSLSAYGDSTYQDSMEAGLMDQIPLNETIKRFYNNQSSAVLESMMRSVLENNPDRYVYFNGLRIFGGDYITYDLKTVAEKQEGFDARTENINSLLDAWPEIDFYAFYIERDTDINFETGEKMHMSTYVGNQLNLPEGRFDCLELNSFADYREYYYKTDHHWSYKGSYAGYLQIADMLGIPEDEQLVPLEEVTPGYQLIGSKALTAGTEIFSDDFTAYRFDFPEMGATLNVKAAEDLGNQDAYFAHIPEAITYANFYGADYAEVILETGTDTGRGNILMLGNSFDNAIIKLVASHYNTTYCVDLRHFERFFGTTFDFSDYIERNNIDTVLYVGDLNFYSMEEFMVED